MNSTRIPDGELGLIIGQIIKALSDGNAKFTVDVNQKSISDAEARYFRAYVDVTFHVEGVKK